MARSEKPGFSEKFWVFPLDIQAYSNAQVSEVQARSITNYQLAITNPRDLPHITEKGYKPGFFVSRSDYFLARAALSTDV